MYQNAYDAYLNNDNEAVHEAYEEMMRQFPLSKIMPKFMFLHALSYVTENDHERFNTTLKELLER
jgi:outer membrane protein assembly factor BamD (BamD/ComL family)